MGKKTLEEISEINQNILQDVNKYVLQVPTEFSVQCLCFSKVNFDSAENSAKLMKEKQKNVKDLERERTNDKYWTRKKSCDEGIQL